MTIKPVLHVLAIALFLLIAGTATNAAGAELDRPADIPGVADARVLIENGKYDEALDALRPLAKTIRNVPISFFSLVWRRSKDPSNPTSLKQTGRPCWPMPSRHYVRS